MTGARFEAVHPVLPVRDVDRSIKFYVDKLGFQCLFQHATDRVYYAVIRRDTVVIHLQWHEEADFQGVEAGTLMLRLLVDDPDALFEEYQARGFLPEGKQVQDTTWGTREFAFFDPDRNGLTFYRGL